MASIGFHTGPGGNRNGLGNHWQQLHNAGIPFFLKAVDDYGPCQEAAGIARSGNVAHIIIFRLTTAGQNDGYDYDVAPYQFSPVQAAAIHWARTVAGLPPEFDKTLVWVEPINEVDKGRADWLGHFAAEIGSLALRDGYKVTLLGWSSGEPEAADWQSSGMRRYLTMCNQRPDRLAVSLHEYSYSQDIKNQHPYLIGRFVELFRACDAMRIGRPTVHITEWGWEKATVPEPGKAIADIDWAYRLYAPYPEIKGAAIWYLGGGWEEIAGQAQKLIAPVAQFMLNAPAVTPPPIVPPPAPPPAPPPNYLHVRLIAPANIRRDPSTSKPAITAVAVKEGLELIKVGDVSGQSVGGDNRWIKAAAFLSRSYVTDSGNGNGRVKTNRSVNLRIVPTVSNNWPVVTVATGVEFEHLGNVKDLYNAGLWAAVALYIWRPLAIDAVPGIRLGSPLAIPLTVTSPFNAPRNYVGEHEGLDYSAPIGVPVLATAGGVVDGVRTIDPATGYGKYVRLKHGGRYKTWSGHLSRIDVVVGQPVTAGQPIGLSGNSGRSDGPHLHLTLQDIPQGLDSYIVDDVIDPTLYMHPAVHLQSSPPAPEPGNLIDLRRFKVAHPDCWRVVRGKDSKGREYQEDVQDMELGNGLCVIRKNDNGEWRRRDGSFFYLVHDTSPAPGDEGIDRVYTLYKNNAPGAPKSKIKQAVGELWQEPGTHLVQFRAKDGCRKLAENSGNATNSSVITRYERNFPFNKYGQNLVFDEVIFEQTGGETQVYGIKDGRSCGWIGWQSDWGSSEPVEVHWDRGKLSVEPNRYCSW